MIQIIFDDTPAVPNEIRAFVGISHFGSIVYRRRSLLEAVRELARKAERPEPIYLRTRADISALTEKLRKEDDRERYLVCPSNLVSSNHPESVLLFLRQI